MQSRLSESARAHPHQFDIHGGGIDLVFPHHENEIAQSRCANHTPLMAKTWMHNGFLQVGGKKMAKSEGNFVTIRDALRQERGDVIRFTMLRTHYRQPIDWTLNARTESFNILTGWERMFRMKDVRPEQSRLASGIVEALEDDLNTPQAIAEMHRLFQDGEYQALADTLHGLGFVLNAEEISPSVISAAALDGRIEARKAARAARNFVEADRIRDELALMGIQLLDSKDPKTGELVTTWEVKR
jgi:cysteinyl-tRNA synthetase